MSQYVYIKSEPELWTVGFYMPSGKWEPESDHGTPAEAAARVRYLNGGRDEPATVPADREVQDLAELHEDGERWDGLS